MLLNRERIVCFSFSDLTKQKENVGTLALQPLFYQNIKEEKKTLKTFCGRMTKTGNPWGSALWGIKCFSDPALTLRLTCCVSAGKLLPLSGLLFPHPSLP